MFLPVNYGCINRGKIGSNGAEINTQLLQLVVSNARGKQAHARYHGVRGEELSISPAKVSQQ